jgi:hypothetical protein
VRFALRSLALALSVALAAGLGACNSGSTGFVAVDVPTALAVEPTELFGTLACGTAQGSLASYVVTFSDVTSADAPFVFAVTPALPCSLSAEVRDVLAGSLYRADVAAFDRLAATLTVAADGTVTDETGAQVEPRWVSTCGDAYPTKAVEASRVVMSDCRALEPVESPARGADARAHRSLGRARSARVRRRRMARSPPSTSSPEGAGPSFSGLACGAPGRRARAGRGRGAALVPCARARLRG